MTTPLEGLLRENRRLREENRRLGEENRTLRARIAQLEQKITHLREELVKLKEGSEKGRYLHRRLKRLWERASSWAEHQQGRRPPALWEWLARRGEVLRLARQDWQGPDCQRLAKWLAKHWGELFTFVRHPGVEGMNNSVERALRPYVVKRKISGGHRS